MRHENSDHNAFIADQKEIAYEAKVAAWLKANPSIGSLNGGRHYRIVNGMTVYLAELEEI